MAPRAGRRTREALTGREPTGVHDPSPAPERRTVLAALAASTGVGELRPLWATRSGRALIVAVTVLAVATIAALAVLWPGERPGSRAAASPPTLPAEITKVTDEPCPSAPGTTTTQQCRTITVDPDGSRAPAEIEIGPAAGGLTVEAGDRVRVAEIEVLDDSIDPRALAPYSLAGLDHTGSLQVVLGALLLLALLALRTRGALAMIGAGLSVLLLASFLVPATLAGRPPLLVAFTGAMAVMFVTLVLTNGVGAQTLASALGITATLACTLGVGVLVVRFTGLDGTGSELSVMLAQQSPGLSLEGVLIAGMVVGGLGVLADTAVTQASAVMALRRANSTLTARQLYAEAVQVGRDHLSATIHTLVLAYAGTTLPLLLVLQSSGVPAVDMLNQNDIAEPILATVIGCVGLIAAVPLTTALAAWVIARVPASALPHVHHHAH